MVRSKTGNRRQVRNYLLQPLLQVRLGLYSILQACVFSALICIVLYVHFVDFKEIVLIMSDAEAETMELFAQYLNHAKFVILGLVSLFLLTNVVISIVFTHRLVGPTVAFTHQIRRLQKGDFSKRVKLRDSDAFHEVARELNQLTDRLSMDHARREEREPMGE